MTPATLALLLRQIKDEHPNVTVQYIKDDAGVFQPRSYAELYVLVQQLAAGLTTLGVSRGDHVGLISENRAEWLIIDLALQCLGAADVPRGNDSMAQELAFILGFSECAVVAVENAEQLKKVASVRDQIKPLKTFVVLDPSFTPGDASDVKGGIKIVTFKEVLDAGVKLLEKNPSMIEVEMDKGGAEDIATIIFTSGTTGEPKGVMLTQTNFIYQIGCIPERIDVKPGDIWLSVLPVWHSFERILQYVALGCASSLAYSKPIAKIMLPDFDAIKPQWMASVPRIWEAVRAGIYRNVKSEGGVKLALFNFFVGVGAAHAKLGNMIRGLVPDFKRRIRVLDAIVAFIPWLLLLPLKLLGGALVFGKIKAKLGGKFIAGISGGGALPPAVDSFFGAAGILLLEGYGLTETAPVLAVRHQARPVPGTVGSMLEGTECRIVAEDGSTLPPGNMGVVYVHGPQVMKGYYNRPEMTAQVLSEDRWLNTGDLGMLTHRGELKLTGRAKDTIVLLGGENIEPLPIEQTITESEYIDTAVVVGQDQKYLGALVVANQAAIEAYAEENQITGFPYSELLAESRVVALINQEINSRVNAKNGFRNFETIFKFAILEKQFEVGKELSAKQEIKRHVIADMYKKQIDSLFK
jgi:long-chain acyl-CoA synthetase